MTGARCTLVIAILLSLSGAARASEDTPASGPPVALGEMREEMHRYFQGEGRGGIWLMAVGAPVAGLGAGLFFVEGDFARGLAYPLLIGGAVEALGGLVFSLNTRRRVPKFDGMLSTRPAAFRDEELPRMRSVNRQFHLLEAVEISLILAGGAMAGVGALTGQELLSGVGTGVAIHAGILLLYDQFAARRALRYTDVLSRFQVNVAPSGAGRASLAFMSYAQTF